MVRVKQFADDLGISKNQAKGLINKGRSRKDGGSQILENVMKPKKYKDGGFPDLSGDGKTTMKDVLIGRGVVEKARGGTMKMSKELKRPRKSRASSTGAQQADAARTEKPKETLVPFKGVLKTSEGEKLRNVDGKTFVVKPPKSNAQRAQSQRSKPVNKAKGGGMAIQGLGFKGVR